MSSNKPYEFGLYVSRHHDKYGSNSNVRVDVVRRSDDGDSIRNVSDSDFGAFEPRSDAARGKTFANLGMFGHVYVSGDGTEKRLIAFEPEFREVFCINGYNAQQIARTMKAWERAYQKLRDSHMPVTPETVFATFANFVGAKFVVVQDFVAASPNRVAPMPSYDAIKWAFNSVGAGVNEYAAIVKRAEDAAVKTI